ncbi:unnamed protein product [Cylicostephanus goldi]|uniref:Uncharacterized protein n=1 Tax=Cylicostephanus goldi TaxID=71465 RepID=A0A3P6SJ41_CYLGO|nr:unnamed protein product [Cylicostephanus goldi]
MSVSNENTFRNQDIYDESDVPAVGVEAEFPEGNVYERREFTMVEPTPTAEPPMTSLFECLSGGTLHLDKAAKMMASKMRAKTFNQAAHGGELALSKQQKVARMIEITEKTTPSGQDRTLSLQNCAKIWTLNFPAPFAKLKLNELITQWEPRKRDNLHQQLTSLFRFILLRATNPPQTIQEYAVRVNKTSGRDVRLRTLPEEVEELLKSKFD